MRVAFTIILCRLALWCRPGPWWDFLSLEEEGALDTLVQSFTSPMRKLRPESWKHNYPFSP